MNTNTDRRAAILCSHVASRQRPILCAERGDPLDAADSGWQFLCNVATEENPSDAKVWAVSEVLDIEPTLAPFIDLPPGTRIVRENIGAPWRRVTPEADR